MSNLKIDDIVKVIINLSPKSAVRKGFNIAMIMGDSDVISPEERTKLYSGTDGMIEDGFTEDMPEYKAAAFYFSADKAPSQLVIGRRVNNEGLQEINVSPKTGSEGKFVITIFPESVEEGNKYVYKTAVSSIQTPTYKQELTSGWTELTSGSEITATSGHLIMVAEVDKGNKALKVGKATIGGSSIPLNIPANESVTEALRACRAKNTDWYAMTYCGAVKQDVEDIAAYIESAYPSSIQFYTTSDKDVLTAGEGNIFETLKSKGYRRSIGQYSETQYAAASIMGWAMGANTGTAGSAYTLKFKTEVGVTPDDLTDQDVINITKNNGNYYVSRGADGEYNMFENGVMADGTWFDEMINLDMLANNMQMSVMDLLKSRNKIPQTESGVTQIKLAIKPDLDKMVTTGFLAPGVWNGPSVLTLETGDTLPDGYMILSEEISSQSQADRDARIAPPIYTPLKLAGAVHSVVLQIDVNR